MYEDVHDFDRDPNDAEHCKCGNVRFHVIHTAGVCIYCSSHDHESEQCPVMLKERRKYDAEVKAKALVEQLGRFVNGMSGEQLDAFATALANEHPTLLGQIAKAVGMGVMRRATYDPTWKPFQQWERTCTGQYGARGQRYIYQEAADATPHADHDGRLDCTTVIGANLMARQSFI